tara:strand:+ start:3681 stop:5855 length:2175 start_codon:yes stop_codon:yes gene_type:complete
LVNNIKTIQSIALTNFKGYRHSGNGAAITLDMTVAGRPADIILVTGKNGVGKTSLLEAMDWVLNQPDVGAGGFRTTGQSHGAVSINGETIELQGKAKTDLRKLETVASFFFQENIAELACNEIIQLLEPENKPADKIKGELKALQNKLENWQRQLQGLKYRKDYEEERKVLAQRVNELVAKLSTDSTLRQELVDSTLTLKNGNLQNRWDSQIRNLSNTIGNYSNLSEPVGSNLSDQLRHIGQCLLEYRGAPVGFADSEKKNPAFTKAFLSSAQSLPPSLPIKRLSPGASLVPSELKSTLFVGSDYDVYASKVEELDVSRGELMVEYNRAKLLIDSLQGNGGSLLSWIDEFSENISSWLIAWEDHPSKLEVSNLKQGIENHLDALSNLASSRSSELRDQLDKFTSEGKAVAEQLNQIKRYQVIARDIDTHSTELSPLLDKSSFTVEDLANYVSNYLEAGQDKAEDAKNAPVESEVIYQLGSAFTRWANLEIEKLEDEASATNLESVELAEKMISDALAICKQESSAKSQLLSVIGVIPQAELEQLLRNMNQLLSSFHFPEDFLPIELINNGTEKSPKWGFATQSGVLFEDLSTGQKSQLAICWTINLNLALSAQLGHSVIGFDDFTTSLDMNQLIPAAVLLRKLAYADADDGWKRQVIVTSHHEDLTNRLLDFLLPPQGKTMKVIQFEEWLPESGPMFKCYNVDMGEVTGEGLQDAVKNIVKTTN